VGFVFKVDQTQVFDGIINNPILFRIAPHLMFTKISQPMNFKPVFCILLLLAFGISSASSSDVELPTVIIPSQETPPTILKANDQKVSSGIGNDTNLLALLEKIREKSSAGSLAEAQNLATEALEKIEDTDSSRFYLRQIRKEETRLYFARANLAMKEKNFSLASKLLERYRENVALELSERKIQREVQVNAAMPKDVSLVGRLVEELDNAKKDLAEIRAKAGLPIDDAKPDLEKLMAEEKSKVILYSRQAERLLLKARNESANARYDLALAHIDEAFANLPANTSTIALISDLFKAKQQVVWYKMGEAMLRGQVSDVQKLVLEYKKIEDSRRKAETDTMGAGQEIDFDAEIAKAQEKNEEQAKLADNMLYDAKAEIKKKNYDKADEILFKIKNFLEPNTLTWPIILEAALMKNRLFLSKAEDARENKDWEGAKKHLDSFRTSFYQDRDIQGDTLTYGRPGLKETRGTKAVERELGLADKEEEKLEDDMKDPFQRDITEYTANWKEQQAQLQELLMRAKVQFVNGDLTGAIESYRVIETRFSENFEAKEMLKRISQMREQESYLGYLKTRQEMLEEIEREWERPKVFDRQVEEIQDVKESSSKLEEKLDLIQISGVQFFATPLPEVAAELMRQARQFDLTESDPALKGVQIVVLPDNDEPPPQVTITLNSMSLRQMIEFITQAVNWSFDIDGPAVTISKAGGSFKGKPMETEFYEVTQGTIQRMTGGSDGGMGGGGAADPFAAPGGGGGMGGDDTGIKIKAFLEGAGVPFDDSKGQKFVFDGFQMIVTHERRSLDLIERILAKLDQDSSRQVEIETKFLEVQEGALDEISFNWQFGWGGPFFKTDSLGNPSIGSDGRPVIGFPKNLAGNTRTLAAAHSPTGTTRDTIISVPDDVDASLNIPNPIPNLPGRISIGDGVSPLMDSTFGDVLGAGNAILGSSQASVLINALKRKQGTDLLSAPRITVMDGQPATITIAQEFIYPTDYEPAPAPVVGGGGGGAAGGQAGLGGAIQLQSAIPTFDTVAPDDEQPGFREVGVVLEVEPTIEKYNSINLRLNPKVTEFDGFIEYGGNSAMIGTSQTGAPPMVIQPSGILMPIFSVRKVDTQVTIFDGATVIIGGLTREEVKTVNDKIPVLGNIPLIGRLFQSRAESYQKRNLLIFVSASIVSRGGSPVREVIQSISPQSIFKDPVIMTPTGTIRRNFKGDDGLD